IAVYNSAQQPITLAHTRVAADSTMDANRWGHLQIPLPRMVVFQCCIGKYARGTDFHEVSAELVFEDPIFKSAKVDYVPKPERIQVVASRVLTVEAHAPLALDAAVHLMINERTEILILKCTLRKPVMPGAVAGHYCHVLQVTLATLIAHGTIVRMVLHDTFNHCGAH